MDYLSNIPKELPVEDATAKIISQAKINAFKEAIEIISNQKDIDPKIIDALNSKVDELKNSDGEVSNASISEDKPITP